MVVVLVVPCPLVLRVWWSWHGVDVCGRWWLTGLQGLGAAVLWWWWALAVAVLLVCPGGLGVGWCGVAGPGPPGYPRVHASSTRAPSCRPPCRPCGWGMSGGHG